MIQIQGQLCYSPEPPEAYARWEDGRPKSPIVTVVDRATGCHLVKHLGVYNEKLVVGLAPWNLFFLLHPDVDALPAAYRAFPAEAACKVISDYPIPAPETMSELFNFAESMSEWLTLPPMQFVKKMSGMDMPQGFSYGAMVARAAAIDTISDCVGGNVVQGKFGARR